MIYQACLSKSLNLFEIEKKFRTVNITPNKEKSVGCTKKTFSKVLHFRFVNFKIWSICFVKGVRFHWRYKKTWAAFLKKYLCLIGTAD